jgi:hypothetical protein
MVAPRRLGGPQTPITSTAPVRRLGSHGLPESRCVVRRGKTHEIARPGRRSRPNEAGAHRLQIPRRYRPEVAELLLKSGAIPLEKSGVNAVLTRSGAAAAAE